MKAKVYKAQEGVAVASYKLFSDSACYMVLEACGTVPAPQTICEDGCQRALDIAMINLQVAVESIPQPATIPSAVAKISNELSVINKKILALSEFLGQGLYIEGVILMVVKNSIVFFPLGRGVVYTETDTILQQGETPAPGTVLECVLGRSERQQFPCWSMDADTKMKLMLCTAAPAELPKSQGSGKSADNIHVIELMKKIPLRSRAALEFYLGTEAET